MNAAFGALARGSPDPAECAGAVSLAAFGPVVLRKRGGRESPPHMDGRLACPAEWSIGGGMTIRFDDDDPRIAYNRVWFNLMRVQRRIGPAIAKALRAQGIADPAWYEILLAVEQGGAEGLPMARLEARLFMPQYALSRHVARLEARGYLHREAMAEDRRAQRLFVTPAGAGLHDRIWPAYMAAIQHEIAELLEVEEAYDLSRLLIRLYDPAARRTTEGPEGGPENRGLDDRESEGLGPAQGGPAPAGRKG